MSSLLVLLEGSPGVGKTSLVENLGKYSGHAVVRINLSEQVSELCWLQECIGYTCTVLFANPPQASLKGLALIVLMGFSVQTDIMDLLGSDLPVESDEGIQFAWSDGILLQVGNLLVSYS